MIAPRTAAGSIVKLNSHIFFSFRSLATRRPVRIAPALLTLMAVGVLAGCQNDTRARRVGVMDFRVEMPQSEGSGMGTPIAETLTNQLMRNAAIGTIPRSDVVAVANRQIESANGPVMRRIGRRLKVDYLIEGSLSKLNNSYILNARLFSVTTGRTVPGTAVLRVFRREDDLIPVIQNVADFMSYQVAAYPERVRIYEEQRRQMAMAQNPGGGTP